MQQRESTTNCTEMVGSLGCSLDKNDRIERNAPPKLLEARARKSSSMQQFAAVHDIVSSLYPCCASEHHSGSASQNCLFASFCQSSDLSSYARNWESTVTKCIVPGKHSGALCSPSCTLINSVQYTPRLQPGTAEETSKSSNSLEIRRIICAWNRSCRKL